MKVDYKAVRLDLEKQITKFKQESQAKNDEFAASMDSIASVSVTKSQFYKFRYDYVVKRLEIQGRVAEIQEHRKGVIRDLLVSQKTKQALDPDFEDFKFEPRNGDERKIFEENYLKELDRVVDVMNNYISTINEAIFTIDKMIFGIPYVIELDKYKNHFG